MRRMEFVLPSCMYLFGLAGTAQQLPTTKGATVQASVAPLSSSNGILQFSYQLSNPLVSSGAIWMLNIDISQPSGSLQLDGSGLPTDPSFLMDLSTIAQGSNLAIKAVAATALAPGGWLASISNAGSVIWGSQNSDLAAGQVLVGFQILSPGLPTIRAFSAQPYIDLDTYAPVLNVNPPSGTPADTLRYKADLDSAMSGSVAQGLTIGPGSPPSSIVPSTFLATIQGYEQQAATLGWISSIITANALVSRLSAVQNALATSDVNTALSSLQSLLSDLAAFQANSSITSEASALLIYNVRYLISYLQHQAGPFACDVNGDQVVSVVDIQEITNEALGLATAMHDLNHDGTLNVTDIQKVIDAVMGLGCPY